MSSTGEHISKSVQIGDRLRQARTSAGLEVSDIATDLRINAEYIDALELNQFDVIGAPTYVKGYLRSYANALKLSPESLIEEYESLGYDVPKLNGVAPLDTSGGNNNRLLHTFSLLVVLVTLGLFVYWLINSGYNQRHSSTETVVYTEPQTPVALSDTPESGLANTRIPLVSTNSDTPVTTASATTAVQQVLLNAPLVGAETVTDSDVASAQSQQLSNAESSTSTVLPELEALPNVPAAPARVFGEGDIISAGDGNDEIIITLSAESWVEIEDAKHFQLMKGVYPSGSAKILRGEAPFQVFLGFAPGVEIIFNDAVYETTTHRRANNTAKFALIN